MMKCEACGATFDKPREIFEVNSDGENRWKERYEVCPMCGEDCIEEVKEEIDCE